MSRPTDRSCELPQLGALDREAGEFWVENPFRMPSREHNLSAYEQNRLFLNLGGEGFLDASFASGADIDADSRSAVAADFDRDGAPDLLVASVGGGPLRLFRNLTAQTSGHHRVLLRFEGAESNRSGIGTRIIAECGERRLIRALFAPNGFMGQAPAELALGIGNASRIDRLIVRWPNGSTQVFRDLPADVRLTFREGQSDYRAVPFGSDATAAR